MKMVKSLVLGSAATLIAMGGAQAADLPVKAKAVEYVKVCSLYGAGFWYIPGTDTCIKLGGYLRVDLAVNTNSDDTGNFNGAGGAKNRFTNAYTWRSREDLNVDTRTATEYGVVRTFFDATFSWTTGSYAGLGNGSTTYASAPFDGVAGSDVIGVYYAYIQFAGFLMGKAISNFSMPWTNYPGNIYDGLVGGGGTVTGVNQFTYTAQLGNGISASIGAQDQVQYYQAGVNNVSAGGIFGSSDYAGTIAPDVVASLQVEQAWGLFKVSAAAHDNHAAYLTPLGVETSGHVDDRWGFAVQAGFSIQTPFIGAGDTLNISGVYTDGATRYNIQDLASQFGAAAVYGNTGLAGAYQSVGLASASDTVFATGVSQQLIQTWGFRGGFTHNWNPYWNTSIYGAWAAVHYNDTSKALICGGTVNGLVFAGSFNAIAAAPGSITTCNPDYDIAQAGIITRWTPVKNLTFAADFTWQHLNQNMVGTVNAGSVAIGKPSAVYELRDQDNILLLLRAQRNW
jgi:porin-like protein